LKDDGAISDELTELQHQMSQKQQMLEGVNYRQGDCHYATGLDCVMGASFQQMKHRNKLKTKEQCLRGSQTSQI
jgi:hypothetical protein